MSGELRNVKRSLTRHVSIAFLLLAVSLLLLATDTARAQTSNNWTNIATGAWFTGGSWGPTNVPPESLTGLPTYVIVFTNQWFDASEQDFAYAGGPNQSFQLNQIRFEAPSAGVRVYSDAGGNFLMLNNGTTDPTITMNASNNAVIEQSLYIEDRNSSNLNFNGSGGSNARGILAIAGSIHDSLSLTNPAQVTKSGAMTLVLSNANDYTLGTIINNGLLIFTNGAVPPTPATKGITVNGNGMVYFAGVPVSTALGYLNPVSDGNGGLVVDLANAGQNINFNTLGLTNMSVIAGDSYTYGGTYTPYTNQYNFSALAGRTLTITNVLGDLYGLPTVLDVAPGLGTVLLTNDNTYSGKTVIRRGTLYISKDANLGAQGTSITMSNNGALRVSSTFTLNNRNVTMGGGGGGFNIDAGQTLTITNLMDGSGGFVKSGGGTLLLPDPVDLVGGYATISNGVMQVMGNTLTNAVIEINVDNGLSLSNDTAFRIGGLSGSNVVVWVNTAGQAVTNLVLGNDDYTEGEYGGFLTNANMTVTKVGLNVQILGGTNKFVKAPTLAVGGGALGFAGTNAIGWPASSGVPVPYGAAMAAGNPIDNLFLTFVANNSSGVVALAEDSANNINMSVGNMATMGFGAALSNTFSGTLTPYGNTYVLGGGGGTLFISAFPNALSDTGGASPTNNVLIDPHGSLIGTVVITSSNNTYSGGTIITNLGVLMLSSPSNYAPAASLRNGLGSGPVVFKGGTLILGGNADNANSWGTPTNTFDIELGDTGTIVSSSRGQIASPLVGGGTLNYQVRALNRADLVNAMGWSTFTGTVVVTPLFDTGGTVGNLRWLVPVSMTNVTLNLSSTNTSLAREDNPSNTSFGYQGQTNVVGELSGVSGSFLLGYTVGSRNMTWRVGDLNTSSTFAGNILTNINSGGGGVNLDKVGSGTLTLLGTNTGSDASVLVLNPGANVPTTASFYSINDTGHLVLGHWYSADPLGVYVINNDGGLIFSNDTTWAIGGLTSTGQIGAINLATTAGSAITLTTGQGNVSLSFGGNISGPGNIVKVGTGLWTLTGSNSWTGGTKILTGTIGFGTNFALPPSGQLFVAQGASIGLFLAGAQNVVNALDPGTAGGIGINIASAAENISFKSAGITNAVFVASQTTEFTGNFTPFTNVYRLGGASGATLWYTNVISDATGAGTRLEIDNFGGTVGLTDSNTAWVVTNTFTGGTIINSNTLYLAGDGSLGSGPLTMGSNTTLRMANAWTNTTAVTMQTNGTFNLDAGAWVIMAKPISGAGPLRKTGQGILQFNTNNLYTPGSVVTGGVTNQMGIVLNGGALVFGTTNAATTGGPLIMGAGAAAGFLFGGGSNTTYLANLLFNPNTSFGGYGVFSNTASATVNFKETGVQATPNLSLVAVQNLTFSGAYRPWFNGGGVGSILSLASLGGVTMSYPASSLTNFDSGPPDGDKTRLVIGGIGGGFGGTVHLTGVNNTGSAQFSYAQYNTGGQPGNGQTTITGNGTLYIDDDSAVGKPGSGGIGTTDRPLGGIVMTNGGAGSPTLRVTNNITLNRVIWIDGGADATTLAVLQTDPGSSLVITNTMKMSFVPNTRGTLTTSGSGLVWLGGLNPDGTLHSLSNNTANTGRMDLQINGGVLRGDFGGGVMTNGMTCLNNGGSLETAFECTSGIIDGPLTTLTTVGTIAGTRAANLNLTTCMRGGGANGYSAYGQDLTVCYPEYGAAPVYVNGIPSGGQAMTLYAPDTNTIPGQVLGGVTNVQWQVNGNFNVNPFILNASTANRNITFSNNIDFAANLGGNGLGNRTISVNATNPWISLMTGRMVNSTNTCGLTKQGVGILKLTGASLYNGPTIVAQGTLAIARFGGVTNCNAIVVGSSTNVVTIVGFTTNNAPKLVDAILDVTGITNGNFFIGRSTNQTLAGYGTVRGSVTITNLGTLAPGDTNLGILVTNTFPNVFGVSTNIVRYLAPLGQVVVPGAGTLIFSSNLVLNSACTLTYDLGTTNDLVIVNGNLTLGGTLNVRDSGGLANGDYTLFKYGVNYGTLSSPGGITVGTIPNGGTGAINTGTPGSVLLHITGISGADPFTTWQGTYFAGGGANPLAAPGADPLGKGMSNTNQWYAGLNPTNANSQLRIISIVPTNATWNQITWKTSGGDSNAGGRTAITNIVQGTIGTTTKGYTNTFYDISANIVITPSGDTTTNYVDQGGTNRYYRIRVP